MSNLSSVTSLLCANIGLGLGLSPEIVCLRLVLRRPTHLCNLRTSRCLLFHTHYDTLKVKRNCSHKDIREAFIKLSKEFHPDKNLNNPQNHDRFIKLSEAYTILSKPYKRADYDLSLVPSDSHTRHFGNQAGAHSKNGSFRDDSFWEHRNKSHDGWYYDRSYYGIDGLRKLPNSWIVAFCIFFTVVGAGLQFLAIRKSVLMTRERLDEMSAHNSALHNQARRQAMINGNELQLQRLRQRLLVPATVRSPDPMIKSDG